MSSIPLRLGTDEEFRSVRTFLDSVPFNDETLCRVLRIEGMNELGRVQWDQLECEELSASLRACLDVLIRGRQLRRTELAKAFGHQVLSTFESLGLLRVSKKDEEQLLCPVWVYPVDGFVIASDRQDDPDGGAFIPCEDVVFPAIYSGTLRFLQMLPEAVGADVLDLCGGSGIGALHMSRWSRTSITTDVTERSAVFAEFNARLNGMPVQSLCGDLYAAVSGRSFDIISAHPPFVPATESKMLYRDGGETGEEIIRRIVEGLGQHLRPGGKCVIVCVARDLKGEPFEERARSWMADTQHEFDIVFGLERVLSVREVIESLRKNGRQFTEEHAQELFNRLQSLDTEQFVYGVLYLRRDVKGKACRPLRIRLSQNCSSNDFTRLFACRQWMSQHDFHESLQQSRVRFAPQLVLNVRHEVQSGGLIPVEFTFYIDHGFKAGFQPDAWIVPLLARMTGAETVRDIFDHAQVNEELPKGFTITALLDLVARMIEHGFLSVDLPEEGTGN